MKNTKKNPMIILIPVLLISCTSIDSSWLQPKNFKSATLKGMIYDRSGHPCQGVEVTISGKSCSTDFNGRFIVPGVSRGTHKLTLKGKGYETIETSIDFNDRKQVFHAVLRKIEDTQVDAESALLSGDFVLAEEILFPDGVTPSGDPEILCLQTLLLSRKERMEEYDLFKQKLCSANPNNIWLELFFHETEAIDKD